MAGSGSKISRGKGNGEFDQISRVGDIFRIDPATSLLKQDQVDQEHRPRLVPGGEEGSEEPE